MIGDLSIRRALVADAQAIATLSRDEIERGLPWSWTAPRVIRAIKDPDTNVVVVGSTSAIDAFGIMSYPDEQAHLLLFAVRPTSRRRGLGSIVLRWLEEAAVVAECSRVRVECLRSNTAARNFYAENGYHELQLGERMYSGIADGVYLEKWLSGASTTSPDV